MAEWVNNGGESFTGLEMWQILDLGFQDLRIEGMSHGRAMTTKSVSRCGGAEHLQRRQVRAGMWAGMGL
jgi:hypothetical protein